MTKNNLKNRNLVFAILFCLFGRCTAPEKTGNVHPNMKEYFSAKPDLTKVIYEGGDGKTIDSSVIIKNANNERNGIAAEYAYISKNYGQKNIDWKLLRQSSPMYKSNRKIDLIQILINSNNQTISLYFDITGFYGKY